MGPGAGTACSINLNTELTPAQRDRYQNTEVIRRLLSDSHAIAMVGLSADPVKASYFVASYLQREGYEIIPINPRGGEILGQKVYPDLRSVPRPIDLVDVFRPAAELSSIVDQAIAVNAPAIWAQLRIVDFDAAEKALAAGMAVVMDKCVEMEHGRFGGRLHWAGMNTESFLRGERGREGAMEIDDILDSQGRQPTEWFATRRPLMTEHKSNANIRHFNELRELPLVAIKRPMTVPLSPSPSLGLSPSFSQE